MIRGITKSGFEFEVSENIGDNMEMLEALNDMSEKEVSGISRVCEIALGKEQKKRLYDHVRTEDGRVPVSAINDAIGDIFETVGKAGKNS